MSNSIGSNGFLTLLLLVFITLKLTGVITWSWWLVTLPFTAPLVLAGVLIGGFILLNSFK